MARPARLRNSAFVEPAGAETVRELIDILTGVLVVTLSIVTVLPGALERMTATCAVVGPTPFDQLAPISHLPLAEVVHLLARDVMFDTLPMAGYAMTIP